MIGALFSALAWIFGKLFGKPPGPSPDAVQAANAAESHTVAQVDQQAAVTETKIAQAEIDAPRTQAAVVDSLNKDTF
jgi:hypothetical protein